MTEVVLDPLQPQALSRRESDHDKTPERLAYLTTALVAIIVIRLLGWETPATNANVIYLVVGQVISGWMLSLGYYYSTTANAKSKDKMLANSVPVSTRGATNVERQH
jgi:hypothetical protein